MMSRPRLNRAFAALLLVVLAYAGIATALHAQSTPTPATLTPDPLLAEVRGLRADLHQAAGASIRAQLLVARLQLQEQRITVLSGQLADVRRQLTAKESAAFPMAESVKRLEEAVQRGGSRDPDQQRDIEAALAGNKTMLGQMQREIAKLHAEEADLQHSIATEQNRWTEFNLRLDELERQLPAR
jgi:chromosome segregation ATPase